MYSTSFVQFLLIYRKQCINETEQFDFLKDIVANVDDTPTNSSSGPHNEDNEKISDDKEPVNSEMQEKATSMDDESGKNHNHKCSISAMLNDDPVTPPQQRINEIIIDSNDEIDDVRELNE